MQNAGKHAEKLDFLCIASGNIKWQSALKITWQFLNKLNMYLPYNPVAVLLGIYPRKMRMFVVHRNLICNGPKLKMTNMFFDRFNVVVYLCNEILIKQ